MATTTKKQGEPETPPHDYRFAIPDQTLAFHRADELGFNFAADEIPLVDETTRELVKSELSEPLARALQFDAFNALRKNVLRPTGMGSPLAREIIERFQRAERFREIRDHTVADDFASGLASCGMVREVVSAVSEETKRRAEEERKAREEAQDAQNYADALRDDPDADPEDCKAADRDAAERQRAAQRAAGALRRALQHDGRRIKQAVAAAAGKAAEEAAAMAAMAGAFGPGAGLDSTNPSAGLPPQEKFRLAKVLQGNRLGFRRLVEILGRFVAEAARKQAAKTVHDAGEIADVVMGSDVHHALEDELALLRHPTLRRLALAKFAQDAMMQYEVVQKETKTKGDFIVLMDESGSMAGQREAEAKGVSLALAHTAARQRRGLVHMCFQGDVTCTTRFARDEWTKSVGGRNAVVAKLADLAARGTGGGTVFDAPLLAAVAEARAGGLREPDIVLITDGDGHLQPSTVEAVEKLKQETGAQVYVLLLGPEARAFGPRVAAFATKVWHGDSLFDGASDLFELV